MGTYYVKILSTKESEWIASVTGAGIVIAFKGYDYEHGEYYAEYDCVIEDTKDLIRIKKGSYLCSRIRSYRYA